MPICEICGAKSKNPNYFTTKAHIKTQRHQKALKSSTITSLGPAQPTLPVQPSLATPQLESRVTALESAVSSLSSKVDFLIDEFAVFQRKPPGRFTRQQSTQLNQNQVLDIIDKFTQAKRSKDNWITIAELFSALSLENADWFVFQATLIKMFDRGIIELIDGTSKRKLIMRGRSYGLIRRKY
ncbi:MAG: hypothetical protein ACE5I5_17510 [Candidatus Heimdallarchaeota archaeon]